MGGGAGHFGHYPGMHHDLHQEMHGHHGYGYGGYGHHGHLYGHHGYGGYGHHGYGGYGHHHMASAHHHYARGFHHGVAAAHGLHPHHHGLHHMPELDDHDGSLSGLHDPYLDQQLYSRSLGTASYRYWY